MPKEGGYGKWEAQQLRLGHKSIKESSCANNDPASNGFLLDFRVEVRSQSQRRGIATAC